MDTSAMLQKIQGAVKQITTDDLSSSILAREKRDEFVQTVSKSTQILDDARQVTMNSHTYDIDRVGFGERIMKAAKEGKENDDTSEPDFDTNTLKSVEAMAVAGLTDSSLEDNIEEDGFEDTLLDLIADRAGIDLAELFIRGDEDDDDSFLALTDGWLKKAANEVDADDDDSDSDDVESVFNQMLRAVDPKYLRDRSEWKFYVPWNVEDAYRDKLRKRNTGLGDTVQTSGDEVAFKGIAVQESSNMPSGRALLVPVNNLVYGLYRDIRIETERHAKKRLTEFVASMRVDCHYEDENAAVAAKGIEV